MCKLTRAQFLAKYADVEVTFRNYYKYVFSLDAALNDRGRKLTVHLGGSADRIWKLNVSANWPWRVRELMPWFWFAEVAEGDWGIEEYRLSRRTELRVFAVPTISGGERK